MAVYYSLELQSASIRRTSQSVLSNFICYNRQSNYIPVATLLGAVHSLSAALPHVFCAPLLSCVLVLSRVPALGWYSSTVAQAQICSFLQCPLPEQDYAGTHASGIPMTAKKSNNVFNLHPQ